MEAKYIWLTIFAGSIVLANFASNRASKNVVDDIEERVAKMPFWKKLAFGFIDVYPYSFLNKKGQRWQTLVLALIPILFYSGYQLSQLIDKVPSSF